MVAAIHDATAWAPIEHNNQKRKKGGQVFKRLIHFVRNDSLLLLLLMLY